MKAFVLMVIFALSVSAHAQKPKVDRDQTDKLHVDWLQLTKPIEFLQTSAGEMSTQSLVLHCLRVGQSLAGVERMDDSFLKFATANQVYIPNHSLILSSRVNGLVFDCKHGGKGMTFQQRNRDILELKSLVDTVHNEILDYVN